MFIYYDTVSFIIIIIIIIIIITTIITIIDDLKKGRNLQRRKDYIEK